MCAASLFLSQSYTTALPTQFPSARIVQHADSIACVDFFLRASSAAPRQFNPTSAERFGAILLLVEWDQRTVAFHGTINQNAIKASSPVSRKPKEQRLTACLPDRDIPRQRRGMIASHLGLKYQNTVHIAPPADHTVPRQNTPLHNYADENYPEGREASTPLASCITSFT
jgi:hypothetical protein